MHDSWTELVIVPIAWGCCEDLSEILDVNCLEHLGPEPVTSVLGASASVSGDDSSCKVGFT